MTKKIKKKIQPPVAPQKKKAELTSSASLNTDLIADRKTKRAEDSVLFVKMKTGEELISIIEKPGSQLIELIAEIKSGPGTPANKKLIIDLLTNDLKMTDINDKDMLEFQFPMKIISVPTPRGNALMLEPWMSPTVNPSQSFRISVNDVLTLARPDHSVVDYYMSMVEKVIHSIAARIKMQRNELLSGSTGSNKQTYEQKNEDYADEELAEILSKVNKPIQIKTSSSEGNNIPFVMIMNEKKTLH